MEGWHGDFDSIVAPTGGGSGGSGPSVNHGNLGGNGIRGLNPHTTVLDREHFGEVSDIYVLAAMKETLALCSEDALPDNEQRADSYQHLVDMVEMVKTHPEWSSAKANRWLGFLQGVAIAYNIVSLEDLIRLNKKWQIR